MNSNRSRKNSSFIVALLILFISIGFAALATNLSIFGNTTVSKQTWDIQITEATHKDLGETIPESGSNPKDLGSVSVDEGNTSVTFSANLNVPGDYYDFVVKVENNGSLDAMIGEFGELNTTLTEDQEKYLTYEVGYNKEVDGKPTLGDKLKVNDGIKHNEYVEVYVKVAYKKDISPEDLNKMEPIKFSSTYEFKYIQSEANKVDFTHSKTKE